MAAIVDAVRHGLTHVESVHRDAERLQKRTGCCVPAPGDVAGASCCAPSPSHCVQRRAMSDAPLHRRGPSRRRRGDSRLARSDITCPLDGLADHLATTLVARRDGAIVGSAALEMYPDGALLRSVAVAPTCRGMDSAAS